MDRNIKEALRGKKRKLDLGTERWREPSTLRAVTPERYRELLCRNQYINGSPKDIYDVINPWILASHGPSQTPHNGNTGRPNQSLMYNAIVPDALKPSAPRYPNSAINSYKRPYTMTLEIREVTSKAMEGSTYEHALPRKAMKIVREPGRLRSSFGEEGTTTALRIRLCGK